MKFLVLFVSVATIAAVSADVLHLAEVDVYSYDNPISSHQSSTSQQYSEGHSNSAESSFGHSQDESIEKVGDSSEYISQSSSANTESFKPIDIHNQLHTPVVSMSYAEVIYGRLKTDSFAPVYCPPSLSASGPAYPAISEEYHKAPAAQHVLVLGPAESSGYLPPVQEVSFNSGQEYNAPVQSNPLIYTSPASIEQKLHGEHYSSQVGTSQEYLAPQEHHHSPELASIEHRSARVEHNSVPEHQPATAETYSIPAPAVQHHHRKYSAPASQAGGYHYLRPKKRFRRRF